MTSKIKNFIQQNSSYIEIEDWRNLFSSWYDDWYNIYPLVDQMLLTELMDVLKIINSDIMNATVSVRSEIIVDEFCDIFHNIQNSIKDEHILHISACIAALHSRLCIDENDLETLFNNAARKCGFELLTPMHVVIR